MDGPERETPNWQGPPVASLGALRRHHGEVRAVVDHQVEALQEIDDSALRTARIAVVALTVVLSAGRLSGTVPLVDGYVAVGCGGLVCTFGLGIVTHGTSTVDLGPDPERVADLRSRPYSEREWLASLLEEYADWIRSNHRVIYWNGIFLQAAQLVLLLSTITLAAGLVRSTL